MIRLAVAADASSLARLRYEFRAALDPAAEPESAFLSRCVAWMVSRLAPIGSWRCWIAEDGVHIVGMVWLLGIDKLPNPVAEAESHGYISSLYVRPEYRGRGLGAELLSACLRACEVEGVDAIILWPTAESRTLYTRHGFAVRDDLMERRLGPVLKHAGPDSESSTNS